MVDIQKLCDEKSTNESKNLRNNLNDLWEKKKLFDYTIKTKDGKSFKAHKTILFAVSGFFKGLFSSDCIETNKNEIELDEKVDSEALELIIEYIYTGKIRNQDLNLDLEIKLVKTTSYLIMDVLKEIIEIYVINSMSQDNFLILWRTDMVQLNDKLRDGANDFLKANCLEFLDCHLLDLKASEIQTIVSLENLNCSQEDLLSNLLIWIKENFNERLQYIKDFLEHIKIKEISHDYINETIIKDEILYQNPFMLQFVIKHMTIDLEKKNDTPIICIEKKEKNPILIDCDSFNEIALKDSKIIKLFDLKKKDGFSASKFRDNDVIFTQPSRVVERFSDNNFYLLPSMLEDRRHHRIINFDNKIYCIGGYEKNSMEILDLNTMKWENGPSMYNNRYKFGAVQIDGLIFAFGGDTIKCSTEIFDTRNGEWSSYSQMQFLEITTAIVHNNKIYITNMYRNDLAVLEVRNNQLEIVKTYEHPKLTIWKNNKDHLTSFIYEDDLYIFNGLNKASFNYCLKLNQVTDEFDIFTLKNESNKRYEGFIL